MCIALHYCLPFSYDRDEYIEVLWDNIATDKDTRRQYEKQSRADTTDHGVPYDYGSIMHYSVMQGSKDGSPTFRVLRPYNVRSIGTAQYFSRSDIRKINLLYGCRGTGGRGSGSDEDDDDAGPIAPPRPIAPPTDDDDGNTSTGCSDDCCCKCTCAGFICGCNCNCNCNCGCIMFSGGNHQCSCQCTPAIVVGGFGGFFNYQLAPRWGI